jgi:hypothetical protein
LGLGRASEVAHFTSFHQGVSPTGFGGGMGATEQAELPPDLGCQTS